MLRGSTAVLLVGALVGPVQAAKQSEALVLTPSTPWNVDYGENTCSVRRVFGTGDQAVTLEMQRFVPTANFSVRIAGKPIRGTSHFLHTRYRFVPGTFRAERRYGMGGMDVSGAGGLIINNVMINPAHNIADPTNPYSLQRRVPAATLEQEESVVRELHIEQQMRAPVVLRIGSLRAVMAQLRDCTDAMLRGWGLDPVEQDGLQRRPKPSTPPYSWIRDYDYPKQLFAEGYGGYVSFVLIVNADGRAEKCIIPTADGPAGFREATCNALMRTARFAPAKDANGQPVRSYFASSVNWLGLRDF